MIIQFILSTLLIAKELAVTKKCCGYTVKLILILENIEMKA